VYKISHSWVEVLILYVLLFGVMYLAWCDFALDPTKKHPQNLCKSEGEKKLEGDPGKKRSGKKA
jgi:hypothetical protein